MKYTNPFLIALSLALALMPSIMGHGVRPNIHRVTDLELNGDLEQGHHRALLEETTSDSLDDADADEELEEELEEIDEELASELEEIEEELEENFPEVADAGELDEFEAELEGDFASVHRGLGTKKKEVKKSGNKNKKSGSKPKKAKSVKKKSGGKKPKKASKPKKSVGRKARKARKSKAAKKRATKKPRRKVKCMPKKAGKAKKTKPTKPKKSKNQRKKKDLKRKIANKKKKRCNKCKAVRKKKGGKKKPTKKATKKTGKAKTKTLTAAQKKKRDARKKKAAATKAQRKKREAARRKARAAAKKKRAADKSARKAARKAKKEGKGAAKCVKKSSSSKKKAVIKAARRAKKAAAKAARAAKNRDAKAAKKAEKEARKAARQAAQKAKRKARKVKKQRKKNRKRNKPKKTGLEIIGGKCVSDHVCASVRGDPHMTTFDGLKYDCQGHGEFVLAKSMSTAFEIQGRFETTNRKDKSVSVTKAVSIDTGVEGAPQFDAFASEVNGVCVLSYYIDGKLVEDFGPDGKDVEGIEFMEDVDVGKETVDYVYFTDSGIMYTVLVKMGSWGCVMNSKICLPPDMVKEEKIIGLLGTPNGDKSDDWMSAYGNNLEHKGKTKWSAAYNYCTREHCVHKAEDSIFGYLPQTSWKDFYGCADNYDPTSETLVANATDECKECCKGATDEDANDACLLECMEGNKEDCEAEKVNEVVLQDVQKKCPDSKKDTAKTKADRKKRRALKKKKAAAEAKKRAEKKAKRAAKKAEREAKAAERAAKKAAAKEKKAAEKAAKRAAREAAKAAKAAKQKKAKEAREARKAAKKAAKEAARKARKAAQKIKKQRKKNQKKKKKKNKDKSPKIVGGQCVADHVCASVRGDPHMTTFDGLKYDCQGHGEFVLAKSMSTAFEIQGRFETTNRKDKSVSVTKAISIDTGIEGAPQFDAFAEDVDGVCVLNYYINGELADFGPEGKSIDGIEFMEDVDVGKETVDYVYFTDSGIMYTVLVKKGSWGCVMNSKICLPPQMVEDEEIIGLLGTPNRNKADDFMSAYGKDLEHNGKTKWKDAYEYCTREHCVHSADDSIFGYLEGTKWEDFYGCKDSYDPTSENLLKDPSQECIDTCDEITDDDGNNACLLECMEGNVEDGETEIENEDVMEDVEKKCPNTDDRTFPAPPKEPEPSPEPAPAPVPAPEPSPTPKKGSGSGDPHFKTWTGDKFDYHGECDLVLVHDPAFNDGQGLRVHIRTTRVNYFSYIEKVAIQIGEETLEFDNDAENFLMNGEPVGAIQKHHKTTLGGFVVRRDPKALSIRLNDHGSSKHNHTVAKIDLHTRKNGFPAVIVDAGHTDSFKGSLGMLGEWGSGRTMARDGKTEIDIEDKMDATAFALEWQVRDTEPMLFKESRFPQFPQTCTPPKKHLQGRLRMDVARKEAEKACAHWKEDMEDCIFDVIATRDVLTAEEGHIIHIE